MIGSTEYIARISYGKDSLKMLDVIKSRGLPLDRITTTDVWATDTISANLPPMDAFKERMDQRIWDMYRIEVEHLCARNSDSPVKFHADGHTVHDFDKRFSLEEEMLIDPQKPFRWSMLDGDLQYRWF
jgi:hypothetical protein